jgi:hypothetical protein
MKRKGQSFLEYSLLIGCIAITLFAMQAYLKRGIQGIVKSTSDDLAVPAKFTPDQLQDQGGRGKGDYRQDRPTTIVSNQDITTTEFARGDRGFVINRDSRVVDAGFTVTQPIKTYSSYDGKSDKAASPANPAE